MSCKNNILQVYDRYASPYLRILGLIFATGFFMGTVAPVSIRMEAAKAFQVVLDSYQGLEGGKLFFAILLQNVTGGLLLLISGALVGVFPLLSIGSNGFFLGLLYRHAAEGVGYPTALLKILPHGIFEIPGLLVAGSYGLWLGVTVIRRIRGKEEASLRFHMQHAFRRYFAVVFPLQVIATTIETALILL